MKYIKGLNDLISHYDAFILDLVGVIHNGIEAFPAVPQALGFLKNHQKKYIFLSNMPRPNTIVVAALSKMGLPVEGKDVVTSGDILRHELLKHDDSVFRNLGPAFYHFGAEKNKDILSGLPIAPVSSLKEADFILCSLFAEEDEPLSQWDPFLQQALDLKLPMVIANPDLIAMHGSKIRYTSGTFGKRYEAMGGVSYYYGKPYLPAYEWVFHLLQERGVTDKKKILMVGDTLDTDILGAQMAGIDSALVLTGNTKLESPEKAEHLQQYFAGEKHMPTWILPAFQK
jgi:HAD superfamily hydrolase (TIGR01459 family)